MQIKLNIRGRIILLFTTVTIVGILFISLVVINLMRSQINHEIITKNRSDLAMAYHLMDTTYRGAWQVKEGKLYKGNTLMNENYSLVDEVTEMTGDTSTIFLGDTRIATTVKKDGKRAIGTKASAKVIDTVLKQGKTYYGETTVVDKKYETAYRPIKDANGNIVGMFYVGTSKTQIDKNINSFIKIMFLISSVILLVIVSVAVIFANQISKRIKTIVNTMAKAENGDLTITAKVNSHDEIGFLAGSFNRMLANIKEMIKEVQATGFKVSETSNDLKRNSEQSTLAVEQVALAMGELAKGNTEETNDIENIVNMIKQLNDAIKQINKGAQEQASNVSQTSALVDQMAKSIKEVDEMSSTVSETTNQTTEVANKGKLAVEETMAEMEQIKKSVFATASQIQELGEQSQQISQIIQVIDDIAAQTNLLALNAAIEAARAGEHGKGFAVVADEVRKLAERSSKATKEIADLITTIQNGTEKAVVAMEKDTQEVEKGSQLAHDAASSLGEIIKMIKRAAEQIATISNAAAQMAANSSEALQAINNVASITEENMAATEQMAASSEQVVTSANNMAAVAQQSAATTEEVSASAEKLNESSEQVTNYAQKLAEMSGELKGSIDKFNID